MKSNGGKSLNHCAVGIFKNISHNVGACCQCRHQGSKTIADSSACIAASTLLPAVRVLNLYAGLGGNRKNWEGVEVTAVEMEEDIAAVYQANFPNDKMIIGDAHQYLLDNAENFDFVWISPPCQTHSRMMKATRHKLKRYSDMSLYQEILFLKHFFKGKWVVENVKPYYEPLIKPTAILGRHYFWSNFFIPQFNAPEQPKGFITKGTAKETEELKKWLGIHYEGNIYYKENHCPGQVLRNCVHPDLGQHIFTASNRKELSLFAE